MNKEELIEKLKGWGTWLAEDGKNDRYVKISKARELINQLDESQKVVVPRFVDEWIKQCKKKATLADCLKGYYETQNSIVGSADFQNWVVDNENDELTAKAWIFGYEVEKEPTWIVEFTDYGGWYFTNWKHSVMNPDGTRIKSNAYKFNDKSKAEGVALLIDGTVEEE